MGFFTAIIVLVVGFLIAFIVNAIPIDIFIKVVPVCWIPKVDCKKRYETLKTYVVVSLIALIILLFP